jgi:hypothetical protein
MAPKLDRGSVKQRLMTDGNAFLGDPIQKPTIEENWKFVFREALFPEVAQDEGKGPKPAAARDEQEKKPKRRRKKR